MNNYHKKKCFPLLFYFRTNNDTFFFHLAQFLQAQLNSNIYSIFYHHQIYQIHLLNLHIQN